jgi:hypothetical protein
MERLIKFLLVASSWASTLTSRQAEHEHILRDSSKNEDAQSSPTNMLRSYGPRVLDDLLQNLQCLPHAFDRHLAPELLGSCERELRPAWGRECDNGIVFRA